MSFRWNRSRYSDMRTHCWQPSVLVVILFLARRIAGSATVYVVTGAGSSNGVYEEKREPEVHYKQLGEAGRNEWYRFLYKGSQHGNTWILGRGDTLSTAKAFYRAPAVEGRPPADQWSRVWDSRIREGKEEGDLRPKMRVVGVETELETNNCFAPQPILKSISLAILVLTVINI